MLNRKILEDREQYLVEECDPAVLLPHLKEILSTVDVEQIQADRNNKGPSLAMSEMINRVKKKSLEGYQKFVVALREVGYQPTAQLLDPKIKVSPDQLSTFQDQYKRVQIWGTASDLVILTRLYNRANPDGTIPHPRIHSSLLKDFGTQNKEGEKLRNVRSLMQQHLPKGTSFVGLTQGSLKLIFRISLMEGLQELCDLVESTKLLTELDQILVEVRESEGIDLAFKELSIMPEERDRVNKVLQGGLDNDEINSILESDETGDLEEKFKGIALPPAYTWSTSGRVKQDLILRPRQKELAQPAVDGKNLIICSPTGSGKTYMAMHIVKEHFQLMSGEVGDGEKSREEESAASAVASTPASASAPAPCTEKKPKVLFIVNRVPLVTQQKDRFSSYLSDYQVEETCGGTANEMPLSSLMDNSDIMVITAQILVNAIKVKDVKLTDFSLLIFDECHHTQKEHPYNKIMSNYISTKLNPSTQPGELPQIVGLTASVGVGGAKSKSQAVLHVLQLCANLDTEVISYDSNDEYSKGDLAKPTRSVKVTLESQDNLFHEVFSRVMSDIENKLKSQPKEKALETIPSCKGEQVYEHWCVKLEDCGSSIANRFLVTLAEQLRAYNNALIINKDCRTVDALRYLEKYFDKLDHSKFMEIDHWLFQKYTTGKESIQRALDNNEIPENPRLVTIMDELEKNFQMCDSEEEEDEEPTKSDKAAETGNQEEREDEFHTAEPEPKQARCQTKEKKKTTKGMLFAKTRDLTEALVEWIKDKEGLEYVKPHILVGASTKKNTVGMNQTEQTEAIKKFAAGEYNLLISTTVGEEGLDIQDCRFVIRYNLPGNEISSVQSRGRIRDKDPRARFTQVVGTRGREQVKMNIFKEILMDDAIREVNQMDQESFKTKIYNKQWELNKNRMYKEQLRYLNQSRHKASENIVFHCKKCNAEAFTSSDVRKYESSYIVISEQFYDVAEVKEHPRPKKLPDFEKLAKIHCVECGMDWGIQAQFDLGIIAPLVKVAQFMLQFPDGKRRKFRQWGGVPFQVPDVEIFDIDLPSPPPPPQSTENQDS